MRWKIRPLHLIVFAVIATGTISVNFLSKPSFKNPEWYVYGRLPDFNLQDQHGRIFTRRSLAGHWWLADFIFTRCGGPCPLMSTRMSDLQSKLQKTRFISITADPAYDTSHVLSEYAAKYGADPSRWFFLTGDKAEINRIAEAVHLNRIDEPLLHSTRFILLDPAGQIRGYYDSTDDGSMDQLVKDLNSRL